jgi:hypothetical protein
MNPLASGPTLTVSFAHVPAGPRRWAQPPTHTNTASRDGAALIGAATPEHAEKAEGMVL